MKSFIKFLLEDVFVNLLHAFIKMGLRTGFITVKSNAYSLWYRHS